MLSEWAVITGASKGIGRATAALAAEENLSVLALGRDENDLQSLKNEVGKGNIYPLSADLTAANERAEIVSFLKQNTVSVNLLVHSAGIVSLGSVAEMPEQEWRQVLEVNLTVPFLLTKELLPFMKNGSQIVFINSVAGRQAFPDWSAYCVSKFGLRALADTLREETESRGIRVTTVFPAATDTPMQDGIPYGWDRKKMLQAADVAKATMFCYKQPTSVLIKELDIQNMAGTL